MNNCGFGFGGGNCCWIIILIIILFYCCGNGNWGNNGCGCGCNNNDCGCGCWFSGLTQWPDRPADNLLTSDAKKRPPLQKYLRRRSFSFWTIISNIWENILHTLTLMSIFWQKVIMKKRANLVKYHIKRQMSSFFNSEKSEKSRIEKYWKITRTMLEWA